MPSTTVTIQGLAELNALLSGLPMAIQRIFQRVGAWYGKAVYDEANSRVPVRTGRLKRSIGQSLSMVEIRIFATAPYASFVNFGTYRMPARPFLTEPAERLEDKFVNDLADGILNYFRSGSVA
jgi:HK97 gp10 family phage protein